MSRVDDYAKTAIIAAVVIGGVYLISRSAIPSLDRKRQEIGHAIGETLFDWLNPSTLELSETIGFQFPDGTYGAVNADELSFLGFFYYWKDGSRWRIAISESGKRFAVPA